MLGVTRSSAPLSCKWVVVPRAQCQLGMLAQLTQVTAHVSPPVICSSGATEYPKPLASSGTASQPATWNRQSSLCAHHAFTSTGAPRTPKQWWRLQGWSHRVLLSAQLGTRKTLLPPRPHQEPPNSPHHPSHPVSPRHHHDHLMLLQTSRALNSVHCHPQYHHHRPSRHQTRTV